jgi:hypothetical protein
MVRDHHRGTASYNNLNRACSHLPHPHSLFFPLSHPPREGRYRLWLPLADLSSSSSPTPSNGSGGCRRYCHSPSPSLHSLVHLVDILLTIPSVSLAATRSHRHRPENQGAAEDEHARDLKRDSLHASPKHVHAPRTPPPPFLDPPPPFWTTTTDLRPLLVRSRSAPASLGFVLKGFAA